MPSPPGSGAAAGVRGQEGGRFGFHRRLAGRGGLLTDALRVLGHLPQCARERRRGDPLQTRAGVLHDEYPARFGLVRVCLPAHRDPAALGVLHRVGEQVLRDAVGLDSVALDGERLGTRRDQREAALGRDRTHRLAQLVQHAAASNGGS